MKRVALITGFTKGIGKAIAYKLAKSGFSLALVYKNSDDKAKEIEKELSTITEVLVIKCDIANYEQIQSACEKAQAKFGFIDTLINNAGISHINFFDKETKQTYETVMNTNFRSVFAFCNILCKDMVSHKFGRIVNISSVWGQKPASMEVLYSASKSAIIGLTRSLNAELAPSGVIVNAVCPGVIDTEMNACFSQEDREMIINDIPMKRMGTTQEVASLVEFLTKEDLYISGADVSIGGGY